MSYIRISATWQKAFLTASVLAVGILVGIFLKLPAAVPSAVEPSGDAVVPEQVQQQSQQGSVSAPLRIPSASTVSTPTQPLQPAVTWSGTPIIIEFDENGATPNVISIKSYETATLILRAKASVPQEGIRFLASQVYGGAPGPIKPGNAETVTIRAPRSFFYSARSPDNKTQYPFYIHINIYN